ncbi:MAG: 16S rRNA processing protein RimM [Gammaproteobacteria bacterium]|nr:16S rRNA processing protein RimM [Gammaproteobacteria bacterium]MYF37779.1 16S rRNA processing protein RimM [Gammaproteobacteria bacterium]
MQTTLTHSFVVVGRVSRPFGVKGWNHLTSFTDPPENLFQYRPWALQEESSDATEWCVIKNFDVQCQGNGMLVCFENCSSRDDATTYVNKLIGVPREVLPALNDDEHYWVDLLGTEVINLEAEHLGTVQDVVWNGAHPILLVGGETVSDLMIPLVPEYVRKIDPGAEIHVSWARDWL